MQTVRMLNFRRVNLELFKELVDETSWETVLRNKGVEQKWQLFKDIFLRAQELLIDTYNYSGKKGLRPQWFIKNILVKLKYKKKMHRQWN